MELEQRFFDEMERLDCVGDKKILIALSGGSDSVALLYLCDRTAAVCGNQYLAVRVRHDIRPAAIEDEETSFCENLCNKLSIPFLSSNGQIGVSLEDFATKNGAGPEQAARQFRHEIIESIRLDNNLDFSLFAHTLDDDRETLLMRIFSGSGPEGLKGIPESRDSLRRPLLQTTRQELQQYLTEIAVRWREDATNSENIYLRNKIRNRLIPAVEETFPGWSSAADTLISRSSEVNRTLETALEKLCYQADGTAISWKRSDWEESGEYIRSMAIMKAINILEGNRPESPRIPWSLVRELRKAADVHGHLQSGGFDIRNEAERVVLKKDVNQWSGREIVESEKYLNHLDLSVGSRRLSFVGGLKDDFPLEIIWKEGGMTPHIQLICLKDGRNIKVTEKLSGQERPDADNDIVYILNERLVESEGLNA